MTQMQLNKIKCTTTFTLNGGVLQNLLHLPVKVMISETSHKIIMSKTLGSKRHELTTTVRGNSKW